MANVKVAVRVRPLSKRENAEGRSLIVEVEDRVVKVRNIKVDNRYENLWDTREKTVEFGFDYCYWSVDPEDPKYASQEVVFQDLGTSVLSGAFKGYNICLFAYGQTGSGKTYTMMGTPTSIGLTPRICEGLFSREDDYSKQSASCRVEVSFLEIYNERVRDLLRQSDHKKPYTLRVREHPVIGPYVQGLSQHVVTDYKQVVGLLEEGIANRITAATHIHEASSRSHAIFTIQYTQAILEDNLPSEIASKINLVDLAGSERADPSYCKDRITEGANINKSLVTLGIVISTLAQNSQMFSSCQSINSIASEVDSSHTDNHCGAHSNSHRRQAYIPYRDSVLTWLLKDSLGGNSKTIMIATISPASSCYNETMSTLRYASNAKNIINKPRINEDANVKLIRELREEIDRLKAMLMSFELRNSSPSWSDDREGNLTELVLQNEVKIEQLTKDWTDKWINRKAIMEEYSVDINKKKAGVVIDSSLPHLMAMDDDILSTGVVLYHLREGATKIGRSDSNQEQDIVLQGEWIKREHCVVENQHGIVTLRPLQGAHCIVNGHEVTVPIRLSQGAFIILGQTHKFRFNHPTEAAILRQRRSINETCSVVSCKSLEWLDLDGGLSSLSYDFYPAETESERRHAVSEECQPKFKKQEVLQRREIQQQQLYVEELQQQILDGEIRAEQELEHDQAVINQQIRENQQWLIDEKKRLAAQQQQESAVQTEIKTYAETGVQNILESETGPSQTIKNKKKLVQQELLRKYSLKKAERHLSRKKVKLRLERIVKKQKLLEAKKNLEQLEATCWINEDNVKLSPFLNQEIIAPSWDYACSQPGSASGSLKCRQNTCLNIQPPHCSFSPERDSSQLSTSEHSYKFSKVNPPRRSVPAEYFNRTLEDLSKRGNIHDERDGSFPIQRQLIKNLKFYLRNKGIEITNRSNTEVFSYICKNNQTMEKSSNRPRQTRLKAPVLKSSDHFKRKYESEAVKQVAKIKTLENSNQHAEKHLEKSEAQEAGRKIRMEKRKKRPSSLPGNSIKELKKSAVCGKSPVQHLSQKGKNLKSVLANSQSVEQQQHLKTASSTRSLININNHAPLCYGEKRWHSAEALSAGISKTAPGLLRTWQEDEDVEFSDTDSNYSVDSLSCDNAKVLTEPLNIEEESAEIDIANLEDSESDDSQMSQDSLAEKVNKTECQNIQYFPEVHQEPVKFCKDGNYQPLSLIGNTSLSNSNLTVNERSFSLDSLGDADEASGEDLAEESKFQSCDEVPAEVFWKLQILKSEFVNSNKHHNPEIINETAKITDNLTQNSSSFYLDTNAHSSFSNIQDQSVDICEQEGSLDERSHSTGENVPVLPEAWLSYDSKIGESSPIMAMCSSQDHREFQIAQLHSVKSNCWMKKDDLRQSAAEMSFFSCSKTHQPSCEPRKIEMLLSSGEPSLSLPETRKQLEIESAGATSSLSLSRFPTKYSYCEVASSLKSVCQQPDDLSGGESTDVSAQISSCLKEHAGTDSSSQVSAKLDLSASSVYSEISKDQDLENSFISRTKTSGETCVHADFEECLFRTIEKAEADSDSDSSTRDSKLIEISTTGKSFGTLPVNSPDLTSLDFSTEEKYQASNYLFSKEKKSLFDDESYYLCDTLSKHADSATNVGEKYFLRNGRNNFDVMQKTRCQQVPVEEIASESKSYQTKSTAFLCSNQSALPLQTSEADSLGVQGNRDVLTESALEVPSFREAEEERGQNKEWRSANNLEFQTKTILCDSHLGSGVGFSGSKLSQKISLGFDAENIVKKSSEGKDYNVTSFSCKGTPSLTGRDSMTDKSVHSNTDIKEKKDSSNWPYETDDKFTSQPNSNVRYCDSVRLGKCGEKSVSEENKVEHKEKSINSEELAKLIKSVNKLECDILEMKHKQNKCLQNYLAVESQSLTAEDSRNSRSCSVIQSPNNNRDKCCKKLPETVVYEETGKEEIFLIENSKEETNVSKLAMGLATNISVTAVSNNNIEGNTDEDDCSVGTEASPNSTVLAVCSNSSILIKNTTDLFDRSTEHVQVDRTMENILCSESTVTAITTESRQENVLNCNEKDKNYSTNNETSVLESLIMYPKMAEEEEADGSKEQNDTAETELHTDRNVALLPDNPSHGFMNSDADNNRTNLDSTERTKTDTNISTLEEQNDVCQLLEVCLDANETHEEKRSANLRKHIGVLNEAVKNDSNNCDSDNSRAVAGQHESTEEFKHINSVETANVSSSLSTDYSPNGISEHRDLHFAEKRLVHCIPEGREIIQPTAPVQLGVTEVPGQNTDEQNTYTCKTENVREHLEENSGNPEVLENRDSSWSHSDTLLSEVSKEMQCIPHSFSRNNTGIVSDSVPVNQTDPSEIINEKCGLSSVAITRFSHHPANSSFLPSVNTNRESWMGDPSISSSIVVSLSNSTTTEEDLQYRETQIDCSMQAGMRCPTNDRELSDPIFDTVMQNKFSPDQLQQNHEEKIDPVFSRSFNYSASEQIHIKDEKCSKPYVAEYDESLAFSPVNVMQRKAKSFNSTDYDLGKAHGEYDRREHKNSEKCLNSFNIHQKEYAISFSPPAALLSETSSQEYLNSIVTQKELNSFVQCNQTNKCPDTEYIETEYKTNSGTFTKELGCQKETTDILIHKPFDDLSVGHSVDSGAMPEDGVNVLGHAAEALWENFHRDEDIASRCNINSYSSESSLAYLNSSALHPKFLLECKVDKCTDFDKSEYLNYEGADVIVSTAEGNFTSLHNLEKYVSSQSEKAINRIEICFQEGNVLINQGLKQTSCDEATPPPLCHTESFSTCTVFKNAGNCDPPESPPSVYKPIADSQQEIFLASPLSASIQVQENPSICHQGFPNISSSSFEASPISTTSHSKNESHAALYASTSSCSVLATSQVQESNGGDSEMHNQQLCASETSSLSFAKENRYFPLSETESNSHLDCSGTDMCTSEIYHKANTCPEPRDPLQRGGSEDFGKILFSTSNSGLDLQGDESTTQLSGKVAIVGIPTANRDDNHTITCEVMDRNDFSSSEQLSIPLINERTSFTSGSRCSTWQENSAKEVLRNESNIFISQNTNRSKDDGRRPGLQSHSLSAPTIVVMCNSECGSESSKLDFVGHNASKSLEELNMSVEPPSPTENDLHRIESLSKAKADSVVPLKYRSRFQKKASQAQTSNQCDKIKCSEVSQDDCPSDTSPVHYPLAVAQIISNCLDTETERCLNNVTSMHGYNMGRNEEVSYQMEVTNQLIQDNKDAMHFISSDINPYVHPWQQDERCKIGWKQYVFGSASNVCSNPPTMSLDNQTVMRCSSVDNDLNSQNSPFHSHLSSYANARMLSSTISSTDDLQGWDVAREGFESIHSDESSKHYSNVSHDELESKPVNVNSSCENILPDMGCSQQSENTSMQVDEFVLLYPSGSDTSSNKQQRALTCEQETQTDAPAKHKRQKRHRRSYTDISARKSEVSKSSFQQPSSWSSVQNLSLHLSQLLHNTSELLGNLSLQTVKDNEQTCHKAAEESIKATMSNTSTQTTEDIGIQTEILGHPQSKIKESQISTSVEGEMMKPQKVNVIVKLVHPNTGTLTKETMPESKGQILHSVPDIRSHDADIQGDSYGSHPTLNKNSSSSSEVPKIQLNTPPELGFSKPKISSVVSSSIGSRPGPKTTINSPASTFCLSSAYYPQDKQPVPKISFAETRKLSSKNRLLVDRASSPILTLCASKVSQQSRLDKSLCSFKGSAGHLKNNSNSENNFRKRGSGPWFDLNSWEQRVDTSSQVEVDSESMTSRESKEACKVATNRMDENMTKELSGIAALNQKQKCTIDTHTTIRTKRLYHSSSTLELSSHGEYLLEDHSDGIPVECSFHQMRDTRRARNFSGGMKYDSSVRNCDYLPAKRLCQKSLNESSTLSLESNETPECALDSFSLRCHPTWRTQNSCPFPVSEISNTHDNGDADTDTQSETESECNTEILLKENTSFMKKSHRLRSYSLRDLPLHNKFSNWCGVKGDPHSSLGGVTRSASDIHSHSERKACSGTRATETEERDLLSERRAREIERLRRERAQVMSGIHLDMNQHPLTVELTEAKLTYGIGETDAQLRILQSGTTEDLISVPIKQQLYERHRKSIEILRKQREERLQCFRRSRSLSPQKHLLQTLDTNQRDVDFPSRRREYLQQLRRDVVENTRVQEPKMRIQHPSEIEILLRDYQKARQETKTEIARARDKLRERAEQEKRRIREQILSQLQKEEAKLKTLVSTSTLCTDSTLSLSSGPTSGYNSSGTATYAPNILGKQEDQTSSDHAEHPRDGGRGRSVIRNHQLYILEQLPKGSSSEFFPMSSSSVERSSMLSPLASSHEYSHSLNVSSSTFPASPVKGYEDLSKHVLANATAEVMAMCSNDLKNLYSGWATAGWKYQCVEKDVLVYYKAFSSSATKHGFLGAGVIDRPLPTILCLLKDPSKRHLYDKTITTAQVHKKITSDIELVYVVSDASVCYQKQPRDFCCISVEARKENVCILAIQSVYEESMPRPCKEMVRGEILPSAWILEPDTVNGRDITKVVYMIQVDLGAPAIPANLLSSFVKRQPLVIARLAHLLAS
uniref:StAR-related lipid transfer protein 9 isoform X1 n=1 Tax=Pogona vitticeps TaxID=103695 RepID=A0ABM5FA84_9SAUR